MNKMNSSPSSGESIESPLPRIVGVALLLEILGEADRPWLTEFLASSQGGELATDEAFLAWLESERARDPALVARARAVLSALREESLQMVAAASRGNEHG